MAFFMLVLTLAGLSLASGPDEKLTWLESSSLQNASGYARARVLLPVPTKCREGGSAALLLNLKLCQAQDSLQDALSQTLVYMVSQDANPRCLGPGVLILPRVPPILGRGHQC